MSGSIARLALMITPLLAMTACGSSNDAELADELAQTRTEAAREAQAGKAAESDAASLRAQANEAALADFYAGTSENPDATAPDEKPDDSAASDVSDAPPPSSDNVTLIGNGPPPQGLPQEGPGA